MAQTAEGLRVRITSLESSLTAERDRIERFKKDCAEKIVGVGDVSAKRQKANVP